MKIKIHLQKHLALMKTEGFSLKKCVVLITILQDGYGPVGCGVFI